ncbi:MAG TPA: carboxypeptidase-like regulatory domain-containing protein [Candidatus Eisenbacteria bacterium]|nr:carboxypeptidase-like regulatory domain-containing protein [Candidatus Eisenbacteria bacterium]
MKAVRPRLLPTIFVLLFAAAVASAGTLQGTVINRSTGKPVPGTDVDLLSPTGGMALLASVKSDAQGNFTASNDAIGSVPVLIRVTYQDVGFNTFAPPGRPNVEVEVFNVTKDPKTINVESHVVIFQPRGDKLIGAEEYAVKNTSNPPSAFFRTEGNFDFDIPDKGSLQNVTATSTLGMDVPQASIDKGKGRYAIAYAFRPGDTNIRLSYELPYPNNAATVKLPAAYNGMRLLLVAPPGMTLTGDGVTAAGQEQGMNVFLHDPISTKSALTVSVSGVPSPQAADAGGQQGQEGNSRTEGAGQQVSLAPPRIDDLKWPLLGGLVALFALGALLLSRKQVVVASVAGPSVAAAGNPKKGAKGKRQGASVESLQETVNASLDSLKDEIFRLELRKQAGTISDQDYAREKSRVEKLLRDLVRG